MVEALRSNGLGDLVYVNRIVLEVPGYTRRAVREIADDYDAIDVQNYGDLMLLLTRIMSVENQQALVEIIAADDRVADARADYVLPGFAMREQPDAARVVDFSPLRVDKIPDRLLVVFDGGVWNSETFRRDAVDFAAAEGLEVLEIYDDAMLAVFSTPPLDEGEAISLLRICQIGV